MNIVKLYYIVSLHQTTTCREAVCPRFLLYYIVSLHQTTTVSAQHICSYRCIISFLYIKPQPPASCAAQLRVVLYRFSTSNHNHQGGHHWRGVVVLYRFSTSNHNLPDALHLGTQLYYIVSLHQTTTQV